MSTLYCIKKPVHSHRLFQPKIIKHDALDDDGVFCDGYGDAYSGASAPL
jgi:hypothetical protein